MEPAGFRDRRRTHPARGLTVDNPGMAHDDAYAAVVHELYADPAVSESQMMGMPSVKVGSKMFCGLFDGDLALKVGRDRAGELIEAGRASPFDPSGRSRPMKDWAQLPLTDPDALALAEEAKAFSAE
jgi:hypothetical protein